MDALFKAVAEDYKKTKSMNETAEHLKISQAKVKKILITMGLYKTPLSVQIARLVALGFNTQSIAAILKISAKMVSANMPYTKTVYNSDTPSENALKIRATRDRQKSHNN